MTYVNEITEILAKFHEVEYAQNFKGDRSWTTEIKKQIAQLGRSNGFKICSSGSPDDCEPEWLYDQVWYREEDFGNGNLVVDIPLVLESEWYLDFGSIKYDFEKLLLANAPLRVMICQSHIANKQKLVEYFHEAVDKFKRINAGDIFLVAILDYETEKFSFESIVK